MKVVTSRNLENFIVRYLVAKGFDADSAGWMAHIIVQAEAGGLENHGINQLFVLAGNIGKDVLPDRLPVLMRETAAAAVLDCTNCAAILSFREAVRLGMAKASVGGTAFVSVLNTGWIAAPGVNLIHPVERGFLCQVWVQNSGFPAVAPFGGIDARLSTNPIALGIPSPSGPVIADFSTSAISNGRAWQMIREGKKAGAKKFLDKDGVATADPEAIKNGGTTLPAGGEEEGYKGFALSLWQDAVTAAAGGKANDPGVPNRQNIHLSLLSPDCLSSREAYDKEICRFLAYVKSSRSRPGGPGVFLPGERSAAKRREAEKNGIKISEEKAEKLLALAAEIGYDLRLETEKG
jgi:L-lactate dehydrogenase